MLKKIISLCTLIILSILISACSHTNTAISLSEKKDVMVPEIEKLYHQYFDLSDVQRNELKARGYSEESIANLDSEDFKQLEATWKLTQQQITYAKQIYPELNDMDLTEWTNADFGQYSITQTNKTYAPTPEQVSELERRGIDTGIARQMLKEYHNYDTLLAQSDQVLNELKNKIIDTEKQYKDFLNYKSQIRAKYKESTYNGKSGN
ncbi:hypothetical protein [Desulfitobacterium sp.]|uniref:hypothetical protein n=1 Tax=Desulfitobacterium sp. TaxID=49981 RepID=UPI002B2040D5|nr:hypothetical protein [Desulfitobacterium sp.]MEA4900533.1 hypothetical protein [Desulfitobacterium sp.]